MFDRLFSDRAPLLATALAVAAIAGVSTAEACAPKASRSPIPDPSWAAAQQRPRGGQPGNRPPRGGRGERRGPAPGAAGRRRPEPIGPFAPKLALPFLNPTAEPAPGTRFALAGDRRAPAGESRLITDQTGADQTSAGRPVPDLPIHDDSHGGAQQRLLQLSGSPAGFAAVWQDGRDGNAGIYLGRLDPKGALNPIQRAIHPPGTGREREPSLVLGGDGRGAVTWLSQNHLLKRSQLGLFRPGESAIADLIPIGSVGGPQADRGPFAGREAGGERAGGFARDAVVALFPEQGGYVAWREGTDLLGLRFSALRPSPEASDPIEPDRIAQDTAGRPHLASDSDRLLVVWPDSEGLRAQVPGPSEPEPESVSAGSGDVVRLVPDPGRGWWLLVRLEETLAVRHLAPGGQPDADDWIVTDQSLHGSDLAVWNGLLAVVTELNDGTDPRWAHGPIRLSVFDRSGRLLFPAIPVPGPAAVGARDPKLAVSRETIVVAWNDFREGDSNVYYRALRPDDLEQADQRFNDDRASADQVQPAIDSVARILAFAVWSDGRDAVQRIRGRRYAPGPGWFGGDSAVSDAPPGDTSILERQPAVAVLPDRSALVAWIESRGPNHRLRARWFDPEGQPAGPAFSPDGETQAQATDRPAVVFEPRTRRAILVHVRASGECVALSLSTGSDVARVTVLSEVEALPRPLEFRGPHELPGRASSPAICVLENGGAMVAWTHRLDEPWTIQIAAAEARGLRQRPGIQLKPVPGQERVQVGQSESVVLLRGLLPSGLPSGPAHPARVSLRGRGDLEPTLTASPRGGFVLAWTANQGPVRDVQAGLYNDSGVSVGPAVLVSTTANEQDAPVLVTLESGDFLCVWEDDLTGPDCVLARRLTQRGALLELGSVRQLHSSESPFVKDRTRPAACPMGDGFLALWDDRRRSRGHDLFAAQFGARFDRGPTSQAPETSELEGTAGETQSPASSDPKRE